MMKKLFAIAAFLLASTAAQAQYSFEYGGHTIRIDPDRGTVSIPGVYDNSGPRTKRSHSNQDSERARKQQAPEQAKIDPPAPAAGLSKVTGCGTWQGMLSARTNRISVRRLGRQASWVLRTGSFSPQPSHLTRPPSHPSVVVALRKSLLSGTRKLDWVR